MKFGNCDNREDIASRLDDLKPKTELVDRYVYSRHQDYTAFGVKKSFFPMILECYCTLCSTSLLAILKSVLLCVHLRCRGRNLRDQMLAREDVYHVTLADSSACSSLRLSM